MDGVCLSGNTGTKEENRSHDMVEQIENIVVIGQGLNYKVKS